MFCSELYILSSLVLLFLWEVYILLSLVLLFLWSVAVIVVPLPASYDWFYIEGEVQGRDLGFATGFNMPAGSCPMDYDLGVSENRGP